MFKDSVFRSNVDTCEWAKRSGIRAVKTFAQTFSGFLVVGATLGSIDWKQALSVSAVALIASIVTSLQGIPEVQNKEAANENNQ